MKKLMILSLSALALTANLTSCKKGENDPFLSLSSRKARVAGEWTVTSIEGTRIDSYTGMGNAKVVSTDTYTYDGTSQTTTNVTTVNGNTQPAGTPDVERFTTEYTFEKDGSFKMVQTDLDANPTATYTYEGTWAFVGKSKTAELKKKEAIIVNMTSWTSTAGGTSQTGTMTGFEQSMTLVIDQLKGKEMIFINNSSETDPDGDFNSTEEKTTLTAK